MTQRVMRVKFAVIASILLLAVGAVAQKAPKPAENEKNIVPIKVEVVFREYKGATEISSLPYTITAIASEQGNDRTNLRMGISVPIITGSFGTPTGTSKMLTNTQFSYRDVGTDIDCRGKSLGGGLFEIVLIVSRSSLYSSRSAERAADSMGTADGITSSGIAPYTPIISSYRGSLDLLMRSGQTIESSMATDPVSGHVIKVDTTLHVMKQD